MEWPLPIPCKTDEAEDQDHREPRTALLRRAVQAHATRDAEVAGFALNVTQDGDRSVPSLSAARHQSRTGKRYGGGIRYELGDAMLVASGGPWTGAGGQGARPAGRTHTMSLASRASAVAARHPAETVERRARRLRQGARIALPPSERTRAETLRYARKAVRLMKAEPFRSKRSTREWSA